MAQMRIRIDRKNQGALAKTAKANMRSVVKEANRIIAEYFSAHKT